MTYAMRKAIDANKKAILLLIDAMGPQEMYQIRRECVEQAFGDAESIGGAIQELIQEKAIVMDKDKDEDYVYFERPE